MFFVSILAIVVILFEYLSFDLSVWEKPFVCRLYFNENGQARIRRAFWIFNASFEVFHFDTDVLYGFEADGPKIVLVSPVSYHMRVQNEKGPVIDVGTRVGRYTIYNTSGLSSAIERDCLPED